MTVGVEAVPRRDFFRDGWKTRLKKLEVFDPSEGLLAEDMVVVKEEQSEHEAADSTAWETQQCM